MKAGYPLDAEAVLIVELDGLKDDQERIATEIEAICGTAGATGSEPMPSGKPGAAGDGRN